jgi:hypothetical protein
MTSPAELLLTELRGKLDGQLATLESVRTRAAVALSVSGVIAGLFGQHLVAHPDNWAVAALAAFVVGSAPAIWILAPHFLTVAPDAADWIRFAEEHEAWSRGLRNAGEEGTDPEANGDVAAAQLAAQMLPSMAKWYTDNEPTLKWSHRALMAAFIGVVVQLVCWAASSTFH